MSPSVVIVRPPGSSPAVDELAMHSHQVADSRGYTVIPFIAKRVSFQGERLERGVAMLDPPDAVGLYRTMHRAAVLVIAFTAVYVRRNPAQERPPRSGALDMRVYVAHKAVHRVLTSGRDLEEALDCFGNWSALARCDGDDDPRVLPFHVFDAEGDWSGLGDSATRDEFRRRYGSPASRTDDARRVWNRNRRAFHGQESLSVACCHLAPGMHWDVRARKGTRLYTGTGIWEFGSDAYLNVYPDATVRRTKSCNARQIWPPRRG